MFRHPYVAVMTDLTADRNADTDPEWDRVFDSVFDNSPSAWHACGTKRYDW